MLFHNFFCICIKNSMDEEQMYWMRNNRFHFTKSGILRGKYAVPLNIPLLVKREIWFISCIKNMYDGFLAWYSFRKVSFWENCVLYAAIVLEDSKGILGIDMLTLHIFSFLWFKQLKNIQKTSCKCSSFLFICLLVLAWPMIAPSKFNKRYNHWFQPYWGWVSFLLPFPLLFWVWHVME